jgi:hypothetical protein
MIWLAETCVEKIELDAQLALIVVANTVVTEAVKAHDAVIGIICALTLFISELVSK